MSPVDPGVLNNQPSKIKKYPCHAFCEPRTILSPEIERRMGGGRRREWGRRVGGRKESKEKKGRERMREGGKGEKRGQREGEEEEKERKSKRKKSNDFLINYLP